jgi:hypothetical protein
MTYITSRPARPIDGPRLVKALGDPDRSPMALTFRASLLLLAAREVGQNVERLAARTGTSRSFVARCARRLLDHGVWVNGETVCEWGDEGPAHPSFWNDVAVAEGKMARRTDESGAFEWVPVGDWIKFYEYRDRSEPTGVHYVPHPRTLPQAPAAWIPAEDAGAELEGEREVLPVASVREAAVRPLVIPVADAGGEAYSRPATDRSNMRPMVEDPVGKLFPDAQWMG